MADLSFSFVATVLPEAGCDLKEWPGETLSVGHAISATLAAPSIDQAKSRIAEVWPGSTRDGVDVNGLPGPLRRRRLLIADMESTIIEQEMLDELADFVGKRAEVEAITEAAMRGELDFEQAINERVALLAGLDAAKLDDLIATRMTYSPGARALVQTMKANGATCALVSGGFTHFTQRVADELGFDEHRANTLEIEDGR
ncbi:MAG: HAD-IB family phosphatase, partial [Pseudomonadota bacterium]